MLQAGTPTDPGKASCPGCLKVVIRPEDARRMPTALEDLSIFVDVRGSAEQPAAIVEAIRQRGGRAGLIVDARNSWRHSIEGVSLDLLILDLAGLEPDERHTFELKTDLVHVRAAIPDLRIGVTFGSISGRAKFGRELAPYIDFVVGNDGSDDSAIVDVWLDGGEIRSAREALGLTGASGAASVMVRVGGERLAETLTDLSQARSTPAATVDVVASRVLTVDEIVAKHQAAVARQAAQVHSLISTGSLTVSFEAPGFPAPITVSADSTAYAAQGETEIEMRAVRVNGIAFAGAGVPRLPIIEPERVTAPPLTITLTDAYRYTLRGTDDVHGVRCYVVDFEPVSRKGSYFTGRAWIDGETFGLVRVEARQTGLRGPIVASDQVDEYRRVRANLWLPSRSHVRQLYEGAAHRTPIDRVLVTTAHEIDAMDFAARRDAARASNVTMLRDTPAGYQYLRPSAGIDARTSGSHTSSVRDVGGRASHVRTMVMGAIFDPNISHPLPFAGLSYVDFDLFGTGTQLNAFFGGTYGQLAMSVPSIGGTRWQLGARAFAILTSFNDRAFVGGLERYDQNISQRPAHGSVWLVRPLTTRVSFKASYELDYTRYEPGDTTAEAFDVPADQLVHGFRASVDGQWDGWRVSAWWNPAVRAAWRPWGMPDLAEFRGEHRDFQRAGVSLSRVAVVSPGLVIRGETSWMAGHDLDRFSRVAFDGFENRLRGYPAALIRYDRGAVLRGSAAWSPGARVRFDGFVDTAFVHDPGLGHGLTRLTGLGTAIEVPAPFGTLMAVEWGYGIQGRRSDGRQGTHVVRVTTYKIF